MIDIPPRLFQSSSMKSRSFVITITATITIFITFSIVLTVLSAQAKILKKIACTQFHQQYTNSTIVSAVVGEGDGSTVYFHFEFRLPNDTSLHKEVWTFQKSDSGTWQVIHKEKIQ